MSDDSPWPRRAAIFGATGGIGAALARLLADHGVAVHGGSRSGETPRHNLIHPFVFDLADEDSIALAARAIADDPPDLVLVATGALTLEDGAGPEKSLAAIDANAMARSIAINTIGPALVAKHVLPLFPRDRRAVFAVLSAKVGSIGDNRIGGWHSYRAGKAALNMLVRNFAIEMRRTHENLVVLSLHPGTVDTALSRPFQGNLPRGQLTTRRDAARNLFDVLCTVSPEDSGTMKAWNGQTICP